MQKKKKLHAVKIGVLATTLSWPKETKIAHIFFTCSTQSLHLPVFICLGTTISRQEMNKFCIKLVWIGSHIWRRVH